MNSINNKKLRGFFVPIALFDNPKYKDLSSDAKLLYGIYTRRQRLSQMNQQKWQDKKGQVFFIFTNRKAGDYLGWSKSKAVKAKKELINYDLLSNKKTMSADHLYLYLPKIRKQDYYVPNDFSAKYQNGSFIPKKLRGFFIPTTLFDNPKYNNLSSNAKLLYGIYTRRQQLSQMNQQKWQDKEGQVFFVFKNQEAGNYLGWGNGKVVRVKKELINYGLLVNKKTMSADHLYLYLPKIRKQDYYKPKDSARYSENNPTIKSQQQVKVPNKFPAKHQNSQFISKELREFFIPTTLFDNPKYNNLSSNAKLLYGIYTRRQQLSQMNQQKWQDKKGRVFFIFTNQEAENYLGWSKSKAVKAKKELINYGLLVNKKTMSADHLYLLVPKIRKQDYCEPKDSARYSENNQSVKFQQQVKIPNKSSAKYLNSKFSSTEHLNSANKETKYNNNTNIDTNNSDTYIQTKNQTSTQINPETLELDKQIFADTHIDILKILADDNKTIYENLKQIIFLAKKKALNFGHVKSSLFNFADKDVKLPFYQCLLIILKKRKQNKIRNLSKYLYVSVRNLFEQIGNKRAQNFYNNTGKSIMWDSKNYFGRDTLYIPELHKSFDNLFDYQEPDYNLSAITN